MPSKAKEFFLASHKMGLHGKETPKKTHCKRGHWFSRENTKVQKTLGSKGVGYSRQCRKCMRIASKRYLDRWKGDCAPREAPVTEDVKLFHDDLDSGMTIAQAYAAKRGRQE